MLSVEDPHYFAGIAAANTSLRRGLVYAIVEDGVGRLDGLVYATLRATGPERTCLVAPRRQLDDILGSGPAEALDAHLESGQLSILESAVMGGAEAADEIARLLTEIAHFNQTTALVLLDHAGSLFCDDHHRNLALARQLRDWAERDNKILILVLRREHVAAVDPLRYLRPCAALFGGIARLRQQQAQQTWQTFHWHHADGVSSDLIQQLLVDDHGHYRLAQQEASRDAAPVANEEMQILALRSVLQPGEAAGAGWQLLEDAATLQAAAAGRVTATILLPFAAGASFDALARAVLNLRSGGGRRVIIVVRELNNQHMRQSQEALLMHLGANLVAPAGVSLSRLLSLCAAVQGQIFNQALPPSFEAAVAATMPDQQQGYLAPAAFITAVQSSLRRGQETRIESCMVRLTLVSGLTPLDALRYCETRRAGDLLTADADAVYLFLYACRDADLAAALKFLFRLPVGELFSAESRYPTPRDIAGACAGLGRSTRGAPDLTAALARATALAPAKTQVPVAAPANNGPVPKRHLAAAPAVRRSLPLLPGPAVAPAAS